MLLRCYSIKGKEIKRKEIKDGNLLTAYAANFGEVKAALPI